MNFKCGINLFTLQPFVNYIIPGTNGLTLISTSVVTADWGVNDDRWTVPLGGGLGYPIQFGQWSTFFTIQAYGNVLAAENKPDWVLQVTAQLLFPK